MKKAMNFIERFASSCPFIYGAIVGMVITLFAVFMWPSSDSTSVTLKEAKVIEIQGVTYAVLLDNGYNSIRTSYPKLLIELAKRLDCKERSNMELDWVDDSWMAKEKGWRLQVRSKFEKTY